MTELLEAIVPKTMHQISIVHLICNSTAFVSYKDLKTFTTALKSIYQAVNIQVAGEALNAFEMSEQG